MAFPVIIPINRVSGDSYDIVFRVTGIGDITGLASELRIVGLGTLTGTVTDADGGYIAFDPGDEPAVLDAAAGSYPYTLVLDPDGGEQRTMAKGDYNVRIE